MPHQNDAQPSDKESKEDELKNRFSQLLLINPGKQDGQCTPCTAEAARLLLGGTNCQPKNIAASNNKILAEDQAFIKSIKEANKIRNDNHESLLDVPTELIPVELDTGDDFINYIEKNNFEPGTIFGVDSEDHCFIILMDFDKKLILLDTSAQLFKEIQTGDDFNFPKSCFSGKDKDKNKTVNIFEERDEADSTNVYLIGVAHLTWNNAMKMEKNNTLHLPTNLSLVCCANAPKKEDDQNNTFNEAIKPQGPR